MPGPQSLRPAHEYVRDAWQRSILFLDVLRQRGNIYRNQQGKTAPHVLELDVELVLDGRTLPGPVNYGLVRIVPPRGMESNIREVQRIASATGELGEVAKRRLAEIEKLFGVKTAPASKKEDSDARA